MKRHIKEAEGQKIIDFVKSLNESIDDQCEILSFAYNKTLKQRRDMRNTNSSE